MEDKYFILYQQAKEALQSILNEKGETKDELLNMLEEDLEEE